MIILGAIFIFFGLIGIFFGTVAFGAVGFAAGISTIAFGFVFICLGEIAEHAKRTADAASKMQETLAIELQHARGCLGALTAASLTTRDLAGESSKWSARSDVLLSAIEKNTRVETPETVT